MIAALLTHPGVLRAAQWVADSTGDNSGGENKKSGPIGVVVIIVLCVACYFLFKSLSKHLKRVREEFPASSTASTSGASSGASADVAPDPGPEPERLEDKS